MKNSASHRDCRTHTGGVKKLGRILAQQALALGCVCAALHGVAFTQTSLPQDPAQSLPRFSQAASAATQADAQQAATQASPSSANGAVPLKVPHSWNPLKAYLPDQVPAADLANSAHIESMIHDGKLQLTLEDAIELALENNLDLAIARYNIPIAEADVMRTKAGGYFRGVNTGIVQNTPGGGVGGFGSGAAGAGAGGTSGGAGGAGAGASGLVQSTLGSGFTVPSYDPIVSGGYSVEHFTEPLANLSIYGVPTLQDNTAQGNLSVVQGLPTGTTVQAQFLGSRVTTNSPYTYLNPTLNSNFRVLVQQQLLAGFGLNTNLRYLRIARNNRRITDDAFRRQVIATVTQIEDMYWDLVAAYQDTRVKQESLDFAQGTLDLGRKQLALNAIPAMDVLKDQGAVAAREEELAVAKSTLQFQELLLKNAVTRNLDDPGLAAMPVVPLDVSRPAAELPRGEALVQQALATRLDLEEANIELDSSRISRKANNNALLPTVTAVAYWAGTGLGGPNNPQSTYNSTAPQDYGGTLANAFNTSAPDYYVGVNVNIPIRNRVLKSDQYRSELEYRQSELQLQQLKKQIRIEVMNAEFALDQADARVTAADQARSLARQQFEIMQKEQTFGAGSAQQTVAARSDLATAESAYFAATTAREKARVELERASGATLETNGISVESAKQGEAKFDVKTDRGRRP